PGKFSLTDAITGSPASYTAGSPTIVQLYVTDTWYNTIDTSILADVTSNASYTSDGPKHLVNGTAIFAMSISCSGSGFTITVSGVTATYTATPSSSFVAAPGSAFATITVLPGQSYTSAVTT